MAARAKALVLEAPAQRWTLQGIGRELGVSPCHLTRSFRHVTGEPLYRFLNRARLAIGLDRIAAGEEGLTGLALDLGFSSHAHFTTAFRREYGRTPSAARALLAQ
ncbi:helix-turn-helix transcriptional regulator [Marinicauda algicola]